MPSTGYFAVDFLELKPQKLFNSSYANETAKKLNWKIILKITLFFVLVRLKSTQYK